MVLLDLEQFKVTFNAFWSYFGIFVLKISIRLSAKSSGVCMLAESLVVICVPSMVFKNFSKLELCISKN